MFGKFSYMVLAAVFAIMPLIFIFIKYRKVVLEYKKAISILFITWFVTSMIVDYYTRKEGYWVNPPETNSGVYVFKIPFEDILSSAVSGLLMPIVVLVLSLKEEKK